MLLFCQECLAESVTKTFKVTTNIKLDSKFYIIVPDLLKLRYLSTKKKFQDSSFTVNVILKNHLVSESLDYSLSLNSSNYVCIDKSGKIFDKLDSGDFTFYLDHKVLEVNVPVSRTLTYKSNDVYSDFPLITLTSPKIPDGIKLCSGNASFLAEVSI